MIKAGLGNRLGAGLISLLIFIPCLIVVDLMAEMVLRDLVDLFAPRAGGVPGDGPPAAAALMQTMFQYSLLVPVTAIAYGMLGLVFGRTPGQAMVKMTILDEHSRPASPAQRLRRYLVNYGWAFIMFIGMAAAMVIQESGATREGDFLFSALLYTGFVSALWLAALILDPIIRALGDREVFFVDKASKTLPYVNHSTVS